MAVPPSAPMPPATHAPVPPSVMPVGVSTRDCDAVDNVEQDVFQVFMIMQYLQLSYYNT